MRADGFETVRLEEVMVPHWVRGAESLELLAPQVRPLPLLGLGGSVSTPPGGIEAEVVVVRSFEEFDALPDEAIAGKIVVWAVEWKGYGGTVVYRGTGASRAAARGAVASLVRSATGLAARLPHTGALRYDDAVPRIPAAAIAPEDSEWMRRMAARGERVRVRLVMEAQTLPDARSANVVVEIPGRELPDEIVVMGGHWDSWDVGQGAHDDGGPSIAAWHALTLLKKLGLQPRRTLRVVLWTNEENGLRGGREYRAGVGDQVNQHVAAIEMDGGLEKPVGFGFGMSEVDSKGGDPRYERAYARLQEIAALLSRVGVTTVKRGGGGADIGPLMRDGVPGLSLDTVGEHYFDWHHTEADTLDKIDPVHLREAVAAFAVMGFVLADMPDRLVEPTPALQPAAATPASP
jgi:Zn-dependent M28 family amino/carboxypeptidase